MKLKVESYVDALLREKPYEDKTTDAPEIKADFGGMKGLILYMADDFNAPLEDFKDYM